MKNGDYFGVDFVYQPIKNEKKPISLDTATSFYD